MCNSNRTHVIPETLGIASVLHAIVAGASGLEWKSQLINWRLGQKVGIKTLRKRATIGSSFRSSFSLAATSMEYVRNTDFTSAACTEIYNENVSSRIDHHLQQTQNTKEGHYKCIWLHTRSERRTFAFLMILQPVPIQVMRMNFSRCDSLSFE